MQLEEIYFRFPRPRNHQRELVMDVAQCLEERKHLIAHSPTGTGKTDAALAPAITYALHHNKTVFFLTPKISQHEIAVQVCQDLARKYSLNLRAVDLVGKKYMCSDPLLEGYDSSGFYELCLKKVRNEECRYYGNFHGYDAKGKARARLAREKLYKAKEAMIMSHLELKNLAKEFSLGVKEAPLCAYEASLGLAKKSQVIIADYFHLLHPSISEIILPKIGKELKDCVVIVDEAHNLPERMRRIMSASTSTNTLQRAQEELKKMGNEELQEKVHGMHETLKKLGRHKLAGAREALVTQRDFTEPLKEWLSDPQEFCSELRAQGLDYMEASGKGSSALISIASFLEKWGAEQKNSARILRRTSTEHAYTLTLKALDASQVTQPIFNDVHSVILMSGTLLPTDMYRQILGLQSERTLQKEYESPFPAHHRLNLVVPNVTTKYTQRNAEEFERIAGMIARTVNHVPGNSAVFFPSFQMLENIAPFLKDKVPRELLKQTEGMNPSQVAELLQRFRSAGNAFGAVLLGAASGSLAEGLDFPGNQLLCAVIVGIPLEEMDLEVKSLIEYYEERFAQGWHYGYLYPAITKAIQASGRVIRTETDEGIAVFMDARYTWENYKKCFPKTFPRITTEEPEKYVKVFWEKGTPQTPNPSTLP
ncbi:MAG: ATP-dependent DNA helicase [Candidatus Diapherotrites archaeon]|nr:ATP-dependent DNA helicase [Candidatus Diapherotrites archaeon]